MNGGIPRRRQVPTMPLLLVWLPAIAACVDEPVPPVVAPTPLTPVVADAREKNRAVTFADDVAPILHARCAECHRPGAVGPFPLLTYEDAAPRADFIKEVVSDRRMPPWHGESKDFQFLDSRRLPPEEIETLARWADSGAAKGEGSPPAPRLPEIGAWTLGEPDLVIELNEVELPADGFDIYKYFVVPIPASETKYLKAIEFRPGNARVVHHANMNLDTEGALSDLVGQAVTTGAMGASQTRLEPISGMLGIWTPGLTPRLLPEGYGHAVEPGTNMVVNVHYNLTGKPETDRSKVGLYFADEPQESPFQLLLNVSRQAGNLELLNIPAGEERHVVRLSRTLPFACRLYATQVHGHYLLRESELTATLPDGKTLQLLKVDDWDFNWQERYLYESRPLLPSGTRIELVSVFDNSEKNPQNPNVPPKPVRYGPSSTDEMCGAGLVLLPEGLDEFELPPGGLPIPARAERLVEFDLDQDGKLSQEELDAMPSRRRMMLQLTYAQFQEGGAPGGGERPTPPTAPVPQELSGFPEGGLVLPEQAKLVRERFDLDKDGKLSREEFDAAPEPLQQQIEALLMRGGPPRGAEETPAPADADSALKLPAEGFPFPEQATVLRERFDADHDGRLSQEEYDAMPDAIKDRLAPLLRKRLAEEGAPDGPATSNP